MLRYSVQNSYTYLHRVSGHRSLMLLRYYVCRQCQVQLYLAHNYYVITPSCTCVAIIRCAMLYTVIFHLSSVFWAMGSHLLSLPAFFLLRRQLPRTGFNATDPWTRSDVVLFKNVLMSGFSFLPPHARCFPKNDSTGSWQNHSLNRYLTPSSFNRYFAISTVHCKVIHVNFNMLCEWLLILTCYPEPL